MKRVFIVLIMLSFALAGCGTKSEVFIKQADIAKMSPSYKEALEVYSRVKKNLDSSAYYASRGDVHYHYGMFGEAVNDYTRAIRTSGKAAYHMKRGKSYMKLNFYKDAIYDFSSVIDIKGSAFPVAYVERAKAYTEKGDYKRAVRDLGKALKRGGGKADVNAAAADLYFRLGKYETAKPYIQKAIEFQPNDPELYLTRAKIFYKTKDANQAISDLKRSISMKPECFEAISRLAWIYSTNPISIYRDGREASRLVATLDKSNPDNIEIIAAAYAEDGEYEMAIDVLEDGMKMTDNLVLQDDFRVGIRMYKKKQNIRSW